MDKANRFLYLNTESLFSCYSQVFGSLPSEITYSQSRKNKDKESENITNSSNINGGINILGNQAKAEMNLEFSNAGESEITKAKGNTIKANYKDSIFNSLEEKICSDKNLMNGSNEIGSYIKINGKIEIIDAEYLIKLLSGSNINKIAQLSSDKNIFRTTIEQAKKVVVPVCNIIPYKRFVLIDDCIMDLNEDFIRDNPDIIMFKYSGKMNAFGYITNIITTSKENDDEKVIKTSFGGFSDAMNEMILSLLNKKELKIVHPIGIYY